MFPLVSVRNVGAHPGEHQHGVSIQISISLGKTFLRISRIRNIPLTWILAMVFAYVPPFISQILDFILFYWTILIFTSIYFEWRDTKNQQFKWYQGRKRHITVVKWYQGRKCSITEVKLYQGRKCHIAGVKWYQGRKCSITVVKWYQGDK